MSDNSFGPNSTPEKIFGALILSIIHIKETLYVKQETLETDVFEGSPFRLSNQIISAQWRASVEYTRSGNVPNKSSVHYCLLTIMSLLHYMHYALQWQLKCLPAIFKCARSSIFRGLRSRLTTIALLS